MAVLPSLSLTLLALLTGFELAVAVALPVATRRLHPEARLQARSDAAAALGRLMPGWYVAVVVLTVAVAWLRPGLRTGVVAVTCVAVIVGTVLVLVPVNSRLSQWSVDDHPTDWSSQVARWDLGHRIRVCLLGAATVGAIATIV